MQVNDPIKNIELALVETEERLPRLALRPKDASKALGISERLLWSLTSEQRIPYCRINRAIVYPVDLLRAWLVQHSSGGDAR